MKSNKAKRKAEHRKNNIFNYKNHQDQRRQQHNVSFNESNRGNNINYAEKHGHCTYTGYNDNNKQQYQVQRQLQQYQLQQY